MVLVDKENVKGYVQMDEKEHTKKEYASKGLAGTALGLGIGGQADPLLSIAQNNPEGYISVIEQELQKLNNVKQQLIQAKQPTQQNINNAINIWDSINNEIASMTNDQKELLAKDETYISIERELQLMIQEELINSVKDKVAASPRGKELLEKQLNNIKVKKEEIIKEANKGAHFDEEYAKWQVSTMYHTVDNGKICKGEIYNYDCAKNVFDKYVRNINSSITVWDVYVAINAQYHDYIRLYSEWFCNINKNELDNKIIESAITFYFKDEDSGSTKTWNYFKTAN